MVSAEDLKKDAMWYEAVDRLREMGASSQDMWMVLANRSLEAKVVVNHQEKSVRRVEITDDELKMIKQVETEYDFIVYYLIEDEGIWPDGCTFKRYTMPYVDKNEDDYAMYREDVIKNCGTCPAYVVNMEEPDCSEITEFVFRNVGGLIINAS